MKHLLAITVALLPSAALAEQFTPQQMLDVMTKSPSNRDVRVQDAPVVTPEIGDARVHDLRPNYSEHGVQVHDEEPIEY